MNKKDFRTCIVMSLLMALLTLGYVFCALPDGGGGGGGGGGDGETRPEDGVWKGSSCQNQWLLHDVNGNGEYLDYFCYWLQDGSHV